MLFKPEMCTAAQEGRKTQTRRLGTNYNLQQKLYALGWGRDDYPCQSTLGQ
jgi:hypothetical protein